MPTGYIQVHAFTSFAQIPLQNVAISVSAQDGTAIALRLTDRSGNIVPIPLPAPELSAGQAPDSGTVPFTTVTISAQIPGYEQITVERVQLFPNTTTLQELEMIPLSELPSQWNRTELFDTPPQNL